MISFKRSLKFKDNNYVKTIVFFVLKRNGLTLGLYSLCTGRVNNLFLLNVSDGKYVLYVSGKRKKSSTGSPSNEIPQGGEFILGQSSRGYEGFNNTNNAFVGHLTHLNIW